MREIGLMFQGPLVLKIGAGEKTQTRRPFRYQAPLHGYAHFVSFSSERGQAKRWAWSPLPDGRGGDLCPRQLSPVGDAGDLIWVRETSACPQSVTYYRATDEQIGEPGMRWRPAVHMPRWAARFTLKVVRSWVQPAFVLSESDARAEGFENRAAFLDWWGARYDDPRGRLWCAAAELELVEGRL